jgi:hypothetical protein
MRRPTAALGSAVFFLLAPGVVAGLIAWLLTGGWQAHKPLAYWMPLRVHGAILLIAGVIALVRAHVSSWKASEHRRRSLRQSIWS